NKTPWYLSSVSGSGTFTNYDNNDWKPYQIIDHEVTPNRQITTYNQNSAPQQLLV
ncbi:hypothetical protein LOAG_08012, partial [Loa loa]